MRYLRAYLAQRPGAADRPTIEAEIDRLKGPAPIAEPPRGRFRPPVGALALGGGGAVLLLTGIGLGAGALAAQRGSGPAPRAAAR